MRLYAGKLVGVAKLLDKYWLCGQVEFWPHLSGGQVKIIPYFYHCNTITWRQHVMNLSERRRVERQFHYRRSPNNRETVPHDNRGHQPNCSQHKNLKGLLLAIAVSNPKCIVTI